MATEIAKAYVQIIPSAEGVQGRLTNLLGGDDVTSAGHIAGNNIGKALVGTLTKVVAAAGIGKLIGDAMSEGGKLQQGFIGGLDTIYGDAADAAREYASAAASAGISMNDYADQAVSFGAALKQAYAGDTAKAVEAANVAILDMADNSAKMGTPLESIQNAYQGFAKQNYTMLDNLKLGYGGTKAEMERLLEDAQKLSGVEYDISNLGDVYDAIHVIQQDLGLTGVAAQEAAETMTGSAAAFGASWKNLLASIAYGMDWDAPARQFAESLSAMAGNVIPMIVYIIGDLPLALKYIFENIDFSGMFTMMTEAIQTIVGRWKWLFEDVDFIGGMTTALQNMAAALPGVLEGLSGLVDAGVTMIGKIGEGLQTAIPEFIANVLPMLVEFTGNIRENAGKLVDAGIGLIKNIIQGLLNALPDLIANVPTIISNICGVINDNMPKILKAGLDIIIMLIKGIISAIPSVIENAGKIVKSIFDVITAGGWLKLGGNVIKGIVNGLKALNQLPLDFMKGLKDGLFNTLKQGNWAELGKNIIQGVVNGLKSMGSAIKDTLMGFATEAFNAVKSFFGIGSPSKLMRDEIGKQIMAGAAIGVEKNHGLFDNAIDDAFSIDNVNVSGMMSGYSPSHGGGSVVINVYGSEGQDVNALANIIMQKLTNQTQAVGAAFA